MCTTGPLHGGEHGCGGCSVLPGAAVRRVDAEVGSHDPFLGHRGLRLGELDEELVDRLDVLSAIELSKLLQGAQLVLRIEVIHTCVATVGRQSLTSDYAQFIM